MGCLGPASWGTTIQGADQLLNDLEIKPASSNLLVSSSMKFWYFSGIVYCFMKTGLPSVTCTFSVCNLVLPTSVDDLEMILPNLDSSMFNTLLFHLSASIVSPSFVSDHFIMASISILLFAG